MFPFLYVFKIQFQLAVHVLYYIICTVFVFLKLKESERTMDTLNTKRETQIVKSSVVDIPWANSFQQTLIVALLRFINI